MPETSASADTGGAESIGDDAGGAKSVDDVGVKSVSINPVSVPMTDGGSIAGGSMDRREVKCAFVLLLFSFL